MGEAVADGDGLYAEIGAFMKRHGLAPTPANYALIYQVMSETDGEAAAAVREATADGVRLTQKEADRIAAETGVETLDEAQPSDFSVIPFEDARRQISAFEQMVDRQREETRDYGRDLETSASRLAAEAGSLADLVRLTGHMISRTRAAERQLELAQDEAQGLRERLAVVQEEALRDPLTGLANRRAFETRLAGLQAAGRPFSLAICDIDHFKAVNDTHGHGVGDRVMKTIGAALETACRGHMTARLGGDEFVILFADCDPAEAARIIDGARDALTARRFRVRETDTPIGRMSFSAGIAGAGGATDEPHLKRADTLLYAAKEGGRGRTRYEGQPEEDGRFAA